MTTPTPDLPRLFDAHGSFILYAEDFLNSVPATRRALYEDVRAAAEASAIAESDLQAALDHVKACADHVAKCEAAMPAKRSFHELWKETFGRPRHG